MARPKSLPGRPSDYPLVLFHILRCGQLISAIIVSGILCYFMYYLHAEHFSIPWTFIVLMSISITTMAVLLLTILLYNFTHLSPKFNLFLNSSISVGWALGLGLLSWSLSSNLIKACDIPHWASESGVMVCRDYKALWSSTVLGLVSTVLALGLDIHTNKKTTRRGIYVLPEDDKDALRLNEQKSMRVRTEGYDAPEDQDTILNVDGRDTTYHNRYGHPEEVDVALNARNMGHHNRFFSD